VVISGETGVGKELVARAIHQQSRRGGGAFVPVDCGAIQPNLIESELFGHEKGAFTGADRLRPGKFEAAGSGTLFLDEVQNLPLATQTKLLRALQERQIFHVGGNQPIDIDIRVIAATNQALEPLIADGRFRQDLYHRLNEYAIVIPPLHQRRDDIIYLAKRFLDLTRDELNKDVAGISPEALERLLTYPWPGNVRELRNVIRRGVLLANRLIEPEHLGIQAPVGKAEREVPAVEFDGKVSFKEMVRRSIVKVEREILRQALEFTGGNKAKAARLLQIDYKTMHTKSKEYGLNLKQA
jgi:two-component system nitrogen regulation response regulator GlnG